MFQTEEEFKEATWFLKKRGISKVGNKDAVMIEEHAETVKICSTSIVKYYHKDGKVEESPTAWLCATIPKEIWPDVKRRLKKVSS